ncbi:hypothetical protein BB558_002652, partial [Smittium angustum]
LPNNKKKRFYDDCGPNGRFYAHTSSQEYQEIFETSKATKNLSVLGSSFGMSLRPSEPNKRKMYKVHNNDTKKVKKIGIYCEQIKIGINSPNKNSTFGKNYKFYGDIIKDTERETEGFTKGSSKVIEPRNSDFENLSSSLGKIRSVSVALLPGKLILRRILEQQNQEMRNFTTWKKKIVLNDQSHQNLLWWKNQLGHKNGKAFIPEKAEIEGTWNAEEINWSINLKELKSIYYAVKKPDLMTKHTSFLYPETERNSFIKPFRTGGNNLDSLHQLQNSSKNRLRTYHNQPCGCTIFYGTSNRMVFNKQNFQEDRQEVGNPQCGSICYKDKKEDIPIHVQGGAKENRKIKNGADTGNTPLKKFSLVFNGSEDVNRLSYKDISTGCLTRPNKRKEFFGKKQDVFSGRLEVERRKLAKIGVKKDAVDLILNARAIGATQAIKKGATQDEIATQGYWLSFKIFDKYYRLNKRTNTDLTSMILNENSE